MRDRTPWTAAGIICGYSLLKSEHFTGRQIQKVCLKIDEYDLKEKNGEVSLKELSDRIMAKCGWTIEHVYYTEQDIYAKKGSYKYWLDKKQLIPQNAINEQSTRYMIFFFCALMDEFNFGKKRLTRVQDYINMILRDYVSERNTILDWKRALLEDAGIIYESPIDPLTQTRGSALCG